MWITYEDIIFRPETCH